MALLSDYVSGTISVAADGVAVTGAGTAWLTAGFQEGDILFANGFSGVVLSVNSNISLTLAQPWRGGALNAAAYRLRYQGDGSRVSAQARQLIELLGGSGNLQALGGLAGAADRLPFFTGAGTMALAGLSEFIRGLLDDADQSTARNTLGAQAALGFTPVQQGGGLYQTGAKVHLGHTEVGPRIQSGGVDYGTLFSEGTTSKNLASDGYYKFPGGMQISWGRALGGVSDFRQTFPTAFPFACTSVAAIADNEIAIDSAIVPITSNVSNTGFDLRIRRVTAGSVAGQAFAYVRWMAVGY